MTDAQTRLEAAWGALASPARDAMFRIQLMEAMERRVLRRRLALSLVGGAAATAVLAIAVPHLSDLDRGTAGQLWTMLEWLPAAAALAGCAWVIRQMRVLGVRP